MKKLGKKLDCKYNALRGGADGDVFVILEDGLKALSYFAISPFIIPSFVEDFDDEEPGALIPSLALIVPSIALFEYGVYLHYFGNHPYFLPALALFSNGLSLGKQISKHKGLSSNYVHDKFERVTNW